MVVRLERRAIVIRTRALGRRPRERRARATAAMTSPPRSVSQALLSPVRHVLASLRTNSFEGERFVGDEGGEDKREEIFARLEAHVGTG